MRVRVLLGFVVAATVALAATLPAAAQTDAERELAERHAPVFRLIRQSAPCEADGEPFAPMSVDVVLDNDDVLLRQAGVGDPIVTRGPAAADLAGRSDGFFLDFNGLALDPGCTYEQDFERYTGESEPSRAVVHARVVQQDDRPDHVAVQYWLYWYYNDWNNTHESDWEFVQVLYEASTVEQALASAPVAVGYAQHEGGERAAWDDGKLDRVGDRLVVYPSRGSHASYFGPAIFLGRRGIEGVGCDSTDGADLELRSEVVMLPSGVGSGLQSVDDTLAWVTFRGRWGERQSGPFNGPTGPITKPRWTHPVDWHEGLRGASVEIPGGTETNADVLRLFCDVMRIGSNQLRQLQASPGRVAVSAGAALAATVLLVRRTTWGFTPLAPLRQRRRVGEILRASATSYWHTGGAMVLLGLAYVPGAILVGLFGAFVSFNAAQATSAALTGVMFAFSESLVAAYHDAGESGSAAVARAASRVRGRLRAIVGAGLLAWFIPLALVATVIGIPFAIRQAVRYQFAIPVATLEPTSSREALRRSSELVAGRWWRTAMTVLVFFGLGVVLNAVLQLLLLLAFGGAALWLYVTLAFLVTGLFVPAAAMAPVLLYGDAVAASREPVHDQ